MQDANYYNYFKNSSSVVSYSILKIRKSTAFEEDIIPF